MILQFQKFLTPHGGTMQNKSLGLISGLVVFMIVASACAAFNQSLPTSATNTPTPIKNFAPALPTPGATPLPGSQPVQISGDFSYTNTIFVEELAVEHEVALVDMHGFVTRDKEWLIPIQSQTLGYAKIAPAQKAGTFWLQLPSQPAGVFDDVAHNGKKNTGVQIFSVAYWPNLAGGPYSDGDDPSRGWPTYLTSMTTDTENNDEVTGGKLVVWSPDDQQFFPTGFGPDGKLFTADDPVGAIPAGYSIIDLDQKPFSILHDRDAQLKLYEPKDVAIKDFSTQSYTQSFDNLVSILRKEYAFNGIQGKQPNWDDLDAKIAPRVKDAENKKDGFAFYEALVDFTYAFKDGHVGLNGGDFDSQYFFLHAPGGYGFAIQELDDGTAMVVYVLKNGPADKAGIQVGDTITQFNQKPIAQAISEVQPLFSPASSDFALRYEQARFLVRDKIGAQASVTFTSKNGAPKTVPLTTTDERESLSATSLYKNYDPNVLPVESRILDSGQGYIKVNSNSDDLNLTIRLFMRAFTIFQKQNVPGVIIDMRQNQGGSPLGLVGYLTHKTIEMGQLEYYSDKTGKFETDGPRDKFFPFETQYHVSKVAVLVGQTCYSACELEAYGFSQLPGAIVVGQTPSAGVEAEVARGQFKMPGGIEMQFPTGRFVAPDGSLFLEGQGVKPTLRVPINAQTVLSPDDEVLKAAEQALK
jgi:C-terminal processing protease CtpA/Prc